MNDETLEGKKARHAAFLKQEFITLAAFSWESFQKFGRGIIQITLNPETGESAAQYCPPDGLGDSAAIMAKAYDPETQFVLVISEPDGQQSDYRLGTPTMTPPMAYGLLNEAGIEEEPTDDHDEIVEAVFNLFVYVEDGIIRQLGAVRYDISGSDGEKITFLQGKSTTDLSEAKRYPVPSNYLLLDPSDNSTSIGINYSRFLQLMQEGSHLEVFEEAFEDMRAPQDPVYCITPVVDGMPMIEGIKRL